MDRKCIKIAPFGTAAHNIDGITNHSAFGMPPKSCKNVKPDIK